MASAWVLTKGLQTVRAEFNALDPDRDKKSDGAVGDLAHQLESASGHNPDKTGRAEFKDGDALNEVRAIDIDSDLRVVSMEAVIQYLVKRGRAGVYLPFRYFIYRRRIWRKSTGWATQTYTGPSPHDEHAHFSGDYGTQAATQKADNWTGSLGLASLLGTEFDMAGMDQATFTKMLVQALKDAAKVDPLATLMKRTDATTNRDVPELRTDVSTLQDQMAEVIEFVRAQSGTKQP